MRFYTQARPYYCGIDLHARSLYVCIVDHSGNICLHKEIKAAPEPLLHVLSPYLNQIVVGVECMHCWYWVADFCEDKGVEFILGHAWRKLSPGVCLSKRIEGNTRSAAAPYQDGALQRSVQSTCE